MADDGYVTILRTTDAAQGELVTEMLRREGIAARFHGVSSTLIGMPAALIEMTVDVPAGSVPRVQELMRDLEYIAAADAVDGETDTEDRQRTKTTKTTKKTMRPHTGRVGAAGRWCGPGSCCFCPAPFIFARDGRGRAAPWRWARCGAFASRWAPPVHGRPAQK